ncbi:hypothetical protein QQF64_033893 [Cirrhinus molitorella]|uniref:General transcription factor II-I repeat domain-containing protein 2-like n=1 Tax=Cirrhinus molitorella TaxID=172907 RepID=A0ABR3MV82_9TELE
MAERKVDFENRGFQQRWEAEYMFVDIRGQLIEKGKNFIAYSLAVDESTDTTDTAQLAVFIRGVDSSLCVTEELLGIKSMHGTTTGKDIFEEVSKCVNDMKLPWDKLTGLTTDGAPAMCGGKNGLVGRMWDKMQSENCTCELTVYHCIIHQESLCGKALKMEHVMNTVAQTVNFIRARALNHRQFQSFLEEIQSELGDVPYQTEVRSRAQVLNRFFELRDEICQFMEMKAFQAKLRLWEIQMQQGDLCHFPCCQIIKDQVSNAAFLNAHFADKLSTLRAEFTRRFADFEAQKFDFELFSNPFAVDVEKAPANIQIELIELQCNSTLKAKYDTVGPAQFPSFIP